MPLWSRAHYHCQHQQRGAEVTPPKPRIYRDTMRADMLLRTVGIGIHAGDNALGAKWRLRERLPDAGRRSTVPARDSHAAALTAGLVINQFMPSSWRSGIRRERDYSATGRHARSRNKRHG